MAFDITNIGLNAIRRILDLARSTRAESLIDYTAPSRVEPLVLIDSRAAFNEITDDLMQSLLTLYSAFYLLGVQQMTTVGRIDVGRQLDRLNPRRSPIDSAANTAGWMMAAENYTHRLPLAMPLSNAMEAINPLQSADDESNSPHYSNNRAEMTIGRDSLVKQYQELANLSVGKAITFDMTDGQYSCPVTVLIRLIASSMPSDNLASILAIGNDAEKGAIARYHGWRSGRLKFIEDILLNNDLIDAHRKNLIKDQTGIYHAILKRRRGNAWSSWLSGNPSVATASNIAIIDDSTVPELELKINGRLDNFTTRQGIFEETGLMIIAVISNRWNRVDFYYRGIKEVSEVSFSSLKKLGKKDGGGISDILKAYQLGNAPTL